MNATLAMDVKTLGSSSDFIKTAPATYGINQNKIVKQTTTHGSKAVKEKVSSGFIGKAGEHYVTSELLFRGFNASIMSVDVGMDLIATKNNKLYSLQVKTANLSSHNSYIFDMRKVALERDYAGIVFYIFVMVLPDEFNSKSLVILPANKVDELIYDKAIKSLDNTERFRVTLKIRKDEIFIGTLDNPIDYYWDNWDIIR